MRDWNIVATLPYQTNGFVALSKPPSEIAKLILYTTIESCPRRGLDPYAYVRDVLTRLPQMTNWQIPEVTPEAWSKRTAAVLLRPIINVGA